MQRLIDISKLSPYPIDITDLPNDECLIAYLADDVDTAPIVLEIPNNPTNGDMIESLLPIKDKWEGLYIPTSKKQIYIKHEGSEDVIRFDAEWWNSPYKGAEHETTS